MRSNIRRSIVVAAAATGLWALGSVAANAAELPVGSDLPATGTVTDTAQQLPTGDVAGTAKKTAGTVTSTAEKTVGKATGALGGDVSAQDLPTGKLPQVGGVTGALDGVQQQVRGAGLPKTGEVQKAADLKKAKKAAKAVKKAAKAADLGKAGRLTNGTLPSVPSLPATPGVPAAHLPGGCPAPRRCRRPPRCPRRRARPTTCWPVSPVRASAPSSWRSRPRAPWPPPVRPSTRRPPTCCRPSPAGSSSRSCRLPRARSAVPVSSPVTRPARRPRS